jgi:2-succinyl-5-enolpyruvyl-6-hydroxy-3-cyclohexene-1-carboxylate synthase
MNLALAEKIIVEAYLNGVREFCLCAGARNSPFVVLLERAVGVKIHHFFEERSASFFALGRIRSLGRPVAVVTTSGTAAAELLPATVEATYVGLPLMLITADRPKSFRGSGAPQTINQIGLYSHYVQKSFDLDKNEKEISFASWERKRPLHVNVSFEEPLLDGPVSRIDLTSFQERDLHSQNLLQKKFDVKNPMIIVGGLADEYRSAVVDFLKDVSSPIYAESISGLRGEKSLQKYFVKGGDKVVEKIFSAGLADSVLRIGGVPTLRFWRDLEDKHGSVPVYSISSTEHSGLARRVEHLQDFRNLKCLDVQSDHSRLAKIEPLDRTEQKRLAALLDQYPLSEAALIMKFSAGLVGQDVYLGNSLPIREWDLVSGIDRSYRRIYANRGANGIDGQISTFLGWAKEDSPAWCLVGDLTALYDLSAPWIATRLAGSLRIVVVNNGGGKIFQNMFQSEAFLNRHSLNFSQWAAMWGWDYQKWTSVPEDTSNLSQRTIIEMVPDERQTELFWQEYSKK